MARANAIDQLIADWTHVRPLTLLAGTELFSVATVADQNQRFEADQALKAQGVHVLRLAPGCACCSSKVLLTTHLSRTLRLNRPQVLILELDSGSHVDKVLAWLEEPQWQAWFAPPQVIQTVP